MKEQILHQLQLRLQQLNYSYSTQKTYLGMLKVFLAYFKEEKLEDLSEEQIRAFLVETCCKPQLSLSYQNQMINSIKHSMPDSTMSRSSTDPGATITFIVPGKSSDCLQSYQSRK